MADVYCPKCGEPTDTYEFHDAAIGLETTYAEVARRFRTEGCAALPGWRCSPDRDPARAEMARTVYAVSGDDMDGASADFDTIALTQPEPARTPSDPVEAFTMPLNIPACRDIATALDSTILLTTSNAYRDTLRHILVEMAPTAWTFTATNSYALAQVTIPAPTADGHPQPTGSFLMHRDTAKTWSKTLKARTTTYARLDVTPDDLALAINNDAGFTTRRTHHNYPNYRTFFLDDVHARPMTDRYEPALWALNPTYLANLCKSAAAIAPKQDVRLDNIAYHPLKPSYWAAHADHIAWTGLLMPVRIA